MSKKVNIIKFWYLVFNKKFFCYFYDFFVYFAVSHDNLTDGNIMNFDVTAQ